MPAVEGSHRIAKFCEYWTGVASQRHGPGKPSFLPIRLRAAQCAIERAFPDLDQLAIPVDVEALAKRREIRAIEYCPMATDGQISQAPSGGYVVSVNSAHSEQRRRFTIAHEIAHTLFFEALSALEPGQLESVYDEGRDRDEERICDFIAARILLPPKQVEQFFKKRGFDVSTVVALAREFDCSLRAAAKRFLLNIPFKANVIYWEHLPEKEVFVARWRESKEDQSRGRQEMIYLQKDEPSYNEFLNRHHLQGRYWIRLGGPLDRYFIDGIAFNSKPRRLLTLVILDEAAELRIRQKLSADEGVFQASLF